MPSLTFYPFFPCLIQVPSSFSQAPFLLQVHYHFITLSIYIHYASPYHSANVPFFKKQFESMDLGLSYFSCPFTSALSQRASPILKVEFENLMEYTC